MYGVVYLTLLRLIDIDRAVGAKNYAFLHSKIALSSIIVQNLSICQTVKSDEIGKWQNV